MYSFSLNQKLLMCVISGFFSGLSHHPLSLGFLAWFSLVPFLYSLYSFTKKYRVILAGFLFGFTYSITQIFWLAFNIGTSPLIAKITAISATLYLSIFYIIFSLLIYRVKKRSPWIGVWSMPIIWVAIEYLKSLGLLGFPWVSIGNSQADYLLPIQIAEYTAVYGVSFWIVLLNAGLIYWFQYNYKSTIIVLLSIFMFPFLLGEILIRNIPENKSNINVTIIQPNIHLSDKHGRSPIQSLKEIINITNKYISDSTNLVIWPETAVNTFISEGSKTEKIIKEFLQDKSFQLLTGFPELEKTERGNLYFNSIGHFGKSGLINSYQKIQPVPLAEHIPFSSIFPSLKKINIGQANWEIGKNHTIFNQNQIKFSGVICYESTYPSLVRKFVNRGAGFISVLVNDGWYESAPEPQQHANQSIFRAIENRKTIVRSANTGISMVIKPSGEIIQKSSLNEKTGISEKIGIQKKITFYSKYGDVFSWIMIIMTIGLIKIDFNRR